MSCLPYVGAAAAAEPRTGCFDADELLKKWRKSIRATVTVSSADGGRCVSVCDCECVLFLQIYYAAHLFAAACVHALDRDETNNQTAGRSSRLCVTDGSALD